MMITLQKLSCISFFWIVVFTDRWMIMYFLLPSKLLTHPLYYASYHTDYWDQLLQDSHVVLVYYSSERFLMSRCWPAIPLANREGSGSMSAGAAAEDLLFSFGLNHLLNVRPLILILPWDSSPWYEIPNRLRREPTAWPILYNVIQINLFKMLSGYLSG